MEQTDDQFLRCFGPRLAVIAAGKSRRPRVGLAFGDRAKIKGKEFTEGVPKVYATGSDDVICADTGGVA